MYTKLLIFCAFIISLSNDSFGQFILAGQNDCLTRYKIYNPPFHIGNWSYLNVDINMDGTADFNLKFVGGSSSNFYGYETRISPLGLNEIAYGDHDTGTAVGACSSRINIVPKNFTLNDTINSNLIWMDTTMIFASISQGYIPPTCYRENTGIQGTDKYIGVRLINTIDTIYGWLHFESISNAHLYLKDYGYELKTDSISISPKLNDTLVNCGSNFSLSVDVNNPLPCINYQWSKNGVDISGATNDSLLFSSVSLNDTGLYSCRITTLFDTIFESCLLKVQVGIPAGPNISIYPSEIWACEGDYGYMLYLYGDMSNVVSFQWAKNGINIPGAQSNVLNLNTIKLEDYGNYTCKLSVMSQIDCIDSMIPLNYFSTNAAVYVESRPQPKITQVGNKLISNYSYGNYWYFQDCCTYESISNEQTITMQKEGQYSLYVQSNYCSGQTNWQDFYYQFAITPNPFEDEITVSLKNDQLYTGWELLNNLGVVVLKGTLTSMQNSINTSTIAKGHYYLKINGRVTKMIKQ